MGKTAFEIIRNKEKAATKCPEFSAYHKKHIGVMLKTNRKAQVKQ